MSGQPQASGPNPAAILGHNISPFWDWCSHIEDLHIEAPSAEGLCITSHSWAWQQWLL